MDGVIGRVTLLESNSTFERDLSLQNLVRVRQRIVVSEEHGGSVADRLAERIKGRNIFTLHLILRVDHLSKQNIHKVKIRVDFVTEIETVRLT